jgi:hypothetical protein
VTPLLPEELGPPPFRFSASAGPTQGAAFTRPYKALVVAMVIISLAWWIRLWQQGHWGDHPGQGGGWFLLAIVLMAWTGWAVLRSRTRIDAEGISQTWIWHKHMPCRELAYARLIRIRGLEWLMAPRLYVRTLLGKFAVFYIADAQVLAQAQQLVQELSEFRRPQ